MIGLRLKKEKPVAKKWLFNGLEDFYVGDNNKVYKSSTNKEVKMVLKKYTRGFYLNRKFYSVVYLRKCLIRINQVQL